MHGIAERLKRFIASLRKLVMIRKSLKAEPLDAGEKAALRPEYRHLGGGHRHQRRTCDVTFRAKAGRAELKNAIPQVALLSLAVPLQLPQ